MFHSQQMLTKSDFLTEVALKLASFRGLLIPVKCSELAAKNCSRRKLSSIG